MEASPPPTSQRTIEVDAARATNDVKELLLLEPEKLMRLRIKQLKDVLKHLDIEPAEIVEKKDLVALVVKHRK